MRELRKYDITKEMWAALKLKFGGTSVTKRRQLTIKFDTYKRRPNHNMRQHLREMSNMTISELKEVDQSLTDEQQVQAAIRSLPHNWQYMKCTLPTMKASRLLMILHITWNWRKIALRHQGLKVAVCSWFKLKRGFRLQV